jgi:hypothetical protein
VRGGWWETGKEGEEGGVDSSLPVYESAVDIKAEQLVGSWIESHC